MGWQVVGLIPILDCLEQELLVESPDLRNDDSAQEMEVRPRLYVADLSQLVKRQLLGLHDVVFAFLLHYLKFDLVYGRLVWHTVVVY
jgi:hypothetical protein